MIENNFRNFFVHPLQIDWKRKTTWKRDGSASTVVLTLLVSFLLLLAFYWKISCCYFNDFEIKKKHYNKKVEFQILKCLSDERIERVDKIDKGETNESNGYLDLRQWERWICKPAGIRSLTWNEVMIWDDHNLARIALAFGPNIEYFDLKGGPRECRE